MVPLPTGTVTFLFTDIEGSTRPLQHLGDQYASLLGDHHRLLREVFRESGGVEVQDNGDSLPSGLMAGVRPTRARNPAPWCTNRHSRSRTSRWGGGG